MWYDAIMQGTLAHCQKMLLIHFLTFSQSDFSEKDETVSVYSRGSCQKMYILMWSQLGYLIGKVDFERSKLISLSKTM